MMNFNNQEALAVYLRSVLQNHFGNGSVKQFGEGPPASLDILYEKAYLLYQEKNGEEAAIAFGMLIAQDPFSHTFWMGLAAARQMQFDYEKALQAFAIASLLDDQDPAPHYHAAICYVALKNDEDARKAIDLAEALAKDKPAYASLKERIAQLKASLSCHTKPLRSVL